MNDTVVRESTVILMNKDYEDLLNKQSKDMGGKDFIDGRLRTYEKIFEWSPQLRVNVK